MKILVINCGSSSIKYKLYDMSTRNVIAAGGMERIGLDDPILKFKNADGQSKVVNAPISNHFALPATTKKVSTSYFARSPTQKTVQSNRSAKLTPWATVWCTAESQRTA